MYLVLKTHLEDVDLEHLDHLHYNPMTALHRDDELYSKFYTAKKNWTFLRKKLESYQSFLKRAKLFQSVHELSKQLHDEQIKGTLE